MSKLPSFLAPEVILDHTNDGVYVTDLSCRILYWNKAAEQITGWSQEEVVGKKCADGILMHVDHLGKKLCEPGCCPLHRCMATNTRSQASVTVYANHKEGYRVPVAVRVSPVRDALGNVVAGVEVFRDVSSSIKDMERARLVQSHSFSQDLPQGMVSFEALYTPHGIVGGDYYQVTTLPDGRHAFVLADVMGHGVAAALYTMTIHALWLSNFQYLDRPGALFTVINKELCKQTLGDSFVTAFMAVVDPASGEFTYATAGHPPPILSEPDGKTRYLESLDMPLGMLDFTDYEQRDDRLAPGARLLLYSDAALEATNTKGEQLGREGLMDLVSRTGTVRPGATLRSIELALLKYAENSLLEDDLALLLVSHNA